MKSRVLTLLTLAGLAGLTAQAAITDGTATFDFNGTPAGSEATTGAGSANLFLNGTDQLFQTWWLVRGPGDTQEIDLPGASTETEIGNVNNLTFVPVGSSGAGVSTSYTLTSTSATSANLFAQLMLTSNLAGSNTYDVFLYVDFDLGGSAGGDSATGGLGGLTITDGGTTMVWSAPGASAFQVNTFSSLRTSLFDAGITNLSSSGVPFGPGDFTGAFQWTFSLNQGETATLGSTFGLNPQSGPSTVPEPGTFVLLGTGLAALGLWRKRRSA